MTLAVPAGITPRAHRAEGDRLMDALALAEMAIPAIVAPTVGGDDRKGHTTIDANVTTTNVVDAIALVVAAVRTSSPWPVVAVSAECRH